MCRWPSLRRWQLITRPYTRKGHQRCMSVLGDALTMPDANLVTHL